MILGSTRNQRLVCSKYPQTLIAVARENKGFYQLFNGFNRHFPDFEFQGKVWVAFGSSEFFTMTVKGLNNPSEFGIFITVFTANVGDETYKPRVFFGNLRPTELIAESPTNNHPLAKFNHPIISVGRTLNNSPTNSRKFDRISHVC